MSRDLDMGGLTFVFVDSKNEVLETTKVGRKFLIKGELYWSDFKYQPNYNHMNTSLTSNFEQAMKVIDCFKKHPNWFDKPRGIFANNRYYSNGWKTRDSGIDWKREYGW